MTLVLLAVAFSSTTPAVRAAGRIVTYRAFDGRTLNGLLMEADAKPAPAVVLLPMLGRPKDDWQGVGDRFAAAGITALAIDLPSSAAGDSQDGSRWTAETLAAVAYLASRPAEVRPASIGVAGASFGASLAALAAAANPSIRSIALVSPSLDYRGVRIEAAMRQYGARPALLIASLHDPYAARTARELSDEPPGRREIRFSETAAHGSVLLLRDPDMVRALVEWFQQTLG